MKKRNTINYFFTVLLFLVTCFIASNIFIVFWKGSPYLKEALLSEEIQFSMRMSLKTATISTIIVMFFAVPSGYILARKKFWGKQIVNAILEIPLSLPYLVLGVCLLTFFSSQIGKELRELGLPVVFHQNGIVFVQLLLNIPFAISMVRSLIEEVDPGLELVAQQLGASSFYIFYSIIFLLCKRGFLSIALLCWSRAIGEFGGTLMLVGVTRMKTETLPGSIYLNISTNHMELAMATAILLLIIAMAVQLTGKFLNQKNMKLWRIER